MGLNIIGHLGLFQIEWSAKELITEHRFVLLTYCRETKVIWV